MRRFLLIVCAALVAAPALPASAALTLITRETFQGVGTLDSGTPGSLGTFGDTNYYKRPVGPRVTGDTTANGYGWSADTQGGTPYCYFARPGYDESNSPGDMVGMWINIHSITGANYLWHARSNGGSSFARLQISTSLLLTLTNGSGTAQGTTYQLAPDTWYWIGAVRLYNSGPTFATVYSYAAYVMPAGGTLTQIGNTFTAAGAETSTNWTQIGIIRTAGGSSSARIGMVSLHTLTSLSDVAYPFSDVSAPASGPFAWYCNPATGSDSNDGTTSATAWASVAKINAESGYLGMMPYTAGGTAGGGDTLTIDGSTTALDLGPAALEIKTQGLKVALVGSEPIKAWKSLAGATWVQTNAGSYPNLWETTDSSATDLTGIVLWEDDKWLAKPNGANIGVVAAAMNTNSGSTGQCYSDGTKIYVVATDNSNPNTNGKTYTRSRYRTANSSAGGSAILVEAPDVWIAGDATAGTLYSYTDKDGTARTVRCSKIWKTALARTTDADPYIGYALQWDTGAAGTGKVSNMFFDYASKHAEGRTASGTGFSVARVDCGYGQCSPYVGIGGQTQAVDFAAAGSGNTYSYLRCFSTVNAGVPGSTAGTVNTSYQSWLSHGSGSSMLSGSFTDCSFCSVLEEQGTTTGTITLTRCVLGRRDFVRRRSGGRSMQDDALADCGPKREDAHLAQFRAAFGGADQRFWLGESRRHGDDSERHHRLR